jgi:hypothetical protein
MINTTQCQHCGGAIEFELDGWQPGAVGDCPHCNVETELRRMEIYAAPKSVPQNRSQLPKQTEPPPARWQPLGISAELVLFLVGFLLIGFAGADALLGFAGLPLLGNLIIGCTGAVWLGLSSVVAALRNIAEKP